MSTAAEIAGFACLAVAAFMFGLIEGLITTGILLCLIGYSIEDRAAVVALRRVTAPMSRAARQKRKQKRAEAK